MTGATETKGAVDDSPPRGVWWALAALVSVGAGTAIALTTIPGVRATSGGSVATATIAGLARGVMAAVPVAVALYACARPAHARFGKLLALFSGVWLVALLSSSSSSLVYSVGRVSGWVSQALLVYVVLTFPTGRLSARVDRILTTMVVILTATLYLPTALLVHRYPTPSLYASCDLGCPPNAFMVVGHEPAFLSSIIDPLRDSLAAVLFIAVATRLAVRIRSANQLVSRTLKPLFAASIGWLVSLAAAMLFRRVAPHSGATDVWAWLLAVSVVGIAVSFLAGIVRWRLFVIAAVGRVNAELPRLSEPAAVRDALARAFEDPRLQIGYWASRRRRWVTPDDQPLEAPAGSDRWLTEVRDGDRKLAAVLHDAVLADERSFIDCAGGLAAMALERHRLEARTQAMLNELAASRARLLAAADSERQRIERDLHDGAQQRLVGLCIELELAAQKAEAEDPREAAMLRQFGSEVEDAIEEFRTLTRGIYPAILGDRGLAEALRAAALRSPVPVTVEVGDLGEYPAEIATAVYFCCLEALQNVAKHARKATAAHIAVSESQSILSFSVSDDGAGFREGEARLGAGIINMRDRISTVGGELKVHSRFGRGTRVTGRVPLAPEVSQAADVRRAEPARSARPHFRRHQTHR